MLGIPRNVSKDGEGTQLSVFSIEVDTIARLPAEKLEKAIKATEKVLANQSVAFLDIQSRVSFLSFCSLGRVFMRRLWDFIN